MRIASFFIIIYAVTHDSFLLADLQNKNRKRRFLATKSYKYFKNNLHTVILWDNDKTVLVDRSSSNLRWLYNYILSIISQDLHSSIKLLNTVAKTVKAAT